MSEYEISIDDLRRYLSKFGPDEEVGILGSPYQCFVARALMDKYATEFMVSSTDFAALSSPSSWVDLPSEVVKVVEMFDNIHDESFVPAYRSQVEQAIPALKKENSDG